MVLLLYPSADHPRRARDDSGHPPQACQTGVTTPKAGALCLQLTTDCAQKWPAFNRAPHYAPTPTLLNRTRPIKRAPKASARPDRGPYVGGPWLERYRSVHHQRDPPCEIRYRAPVQGGNGPLSHLKLTSTVEVEVDALAVPLGPAPAQFGTEWQNYGGNIGGTSLQGATTCVYLSRIGGAPDRVRPERA